MADWLGNQIKIFSKEEEVFHTITSDMLLGYQKFDGPSGVDVDLRNRYYRGSSEG